MASVNDGALNVALPPLYMCHKHSRQLRQRNDFPIQYERVTSETTFLLTGQGNNRIDRQFENDINETRIKIVKIATIGMMFLRYKHFLLEYLDHFFILL